MQIHLLADLCQRMAVLNLGLRHGSLRAALVSAPAKSVLSAARCSRRCRLAISVKDGAQGSEEWGIGQVNGYGMRGKCIEQDTFMAWKASWNKVLRK